MMILVKLNKILLDAQKIRSTGNLLVELMGYEFQAQQAKHH